MITHPVLRWFCLAFALSALFAIGMFECSSPPARPIRLIHAHGSRSKPDTVAPSGIAHAPIAINVVNAEDDAPELDEPGVYSDDGSIDLVAVREKAFDAWRLADPEPEAWRLADGIIRACARIKFINSFIGRTPEDAIDACLDHFGAEEE